METTGKIRKAEMNKSASQRPLREADNKEVENQGTSIKGNSKINNKAKRPNFLLRLL